MATRLCIQDSGQRSTCSGLVWRLAAIRRLRWQSRSSPVETSFMNRKLILILLAAVVAVASTALFAGRVHPDTPLETSGTDETPNIRPALKKAGRTAPNFLHTSDSSHPMPCLSPPYVN